MTTKRRKLITAALALVLVIALSVLVVSAQRSGVSAHSLDKRLKIYDVRYFPGTNFDYVYVPLEMQIKYRSQQLLKWVGIKSNPSRAVIPINMKGVGPALLLCGENEGLFSNPNPTPGFFYTTQLRLILDSGEDVGHGGALRDYKKNNRFLWIYSLYDWRNHDSVLQLTNGTYHLRYASEDETNDLAIIRVR